MLSSLLREHQAHSAELKDEAEQARRAAVKSAADVTDALVDEVNGGVMAVWSNHRMVDAEVRQLQANTARFAKQTTQWLDLVGNFNTALKELGDVENWAKTIERDMQSIHQFLEDEEAKTPAAAAPAAGPSAPPN